MRASWLFMQHRSPAGWLRSTGFRDFFLIRQACLWVSAAAPCPATFVKFNQARGDVRMLSASFMLFLRFAFPSQHLKLARKIWSAQICWAKLEAVAWPSSELFSGFYFKVNRYITDQSLMIIEFEMRSQHFWFKAVVHYNWKKIWIHSIKQISWIIAQILVSFRIILLIAFSGHACCGNFANETQDMISGQPISTCVVFKPLVAPHLQRPTLS